MIENRNLAYHEWVVNACKDRGFGDNVIDLFQFDDFCLLQGFQGVVFIVDFRFYQPDSSKRPYRMLKLGQVEVNCLCPRSA